ncbi:MAG TPA: glycoside hydrolase family 3 C-terminal domain-containing protein [Bryobacteraceae bacterium]|nr:glycoside hydrolase family 3 C-terminal domain-containing protein [Bryobacteraceae bacterium]
MRTTCAALLGAALMIAALACSGPESTPSPFRDKRLPLERRVADLIFRMHPDEKLVLVRGAEAGVIPENKRLGIPAMRAVDGVMGISAKDDSGTPVTATAFPVNTALAATWNAGLLDQVGVVIAQQAHALQRDQVLGPVVDMVRSPLSGRVFEGYGEDPFLASQMADSYISGVQGEGEMATAIFDGGDLDSRAAREYDLRPLEAAVSEAGVWAVKAQDISVRDFITGELGFKGFTMTPPDERPEVIDAQLHGILRAMFANGIMDRERAAETPRMPTAVETPAQRTIARVAADQSIVLLKNDGDILPLSSARIRSIAVFGPNAQANRMAGGRYTVTAHYGRTPFEALHLLLGGTITAPASPADAAKSDVAIVFAGTGAETENDGRDRTSLNLPAGQDELIAAVAKANPKTIVVINSGSVVAMNKWAGKVPAILQAWFGGEEGGNAIADILTGEVEPSGRLPITIPASPKDVPPEDSGLFAGYRWFDRKGIEPLFPFGHGLSYTRFEYSNLTVTPPHVSQGQFVSVGLTVKNVGSREGRETVQLYLHATKSADSIERPVQELKAFQQIALDPGQAKRINFTLSDLVTEYFDEHRHDWAQDQAEFEVRAGSSSRDIRATAAFSVSE